MDSNQFNGGQQPNPYFNNADGYGQPQKAPNIFQQFALSFVPSQYGRLAKVKTGSMIGFVVLLVLFVTVVQFIVTALGLAVLLNPQSMEENIPEFSLKNGELTIAGDDIILDQGRLLIYITDEKNSFTYDDVKELSDKGYTQILLIGKKNLAIMQNGKYQQVAFRDFAKGFSIDKDWAINELVPIIWVCVCVGFVFYFIGSALWYFLCAAAYLLIGLIICSVMNKTVPAGTLYRTAIYAKVIMFMVTFLFKLIPLAGSGFLVLVSPVVTILFMTFAIRQLPPQAA